MPEALVLVRNGKGGEARVSEKAARLLTEAGWIEVFEGPPALEWRPARLGRPRPLRIVAHVHRYPPTHCAGAEMMLHSLLRHLVARGSEARVLAQNGARKPIELDGISVEPLGDRADRVYRWAEVAITHLDCTREAVSLAAATARPIVHLVHNDRQLAFHRVRSSPEALVVFNSAWIARTVPWPGRWIIVRPPVYAADYRTRPGSSITLVNLTKEKGSEVFYALARRFPDRTFLGVRGAYGHQEIHQLPNVELLEHTSDMRPVYGRTRILLAPSSYESWGRVVVEAAASGIPTIAHPTPGLKESLAGAGIFIDRDAVDAWAAAVEALDDPARYAEASAGARARSEELDPTPDLERFEAALVGFVAERAAAAA